MPFFSCLHFSEQNTDPVTETPETHIVAAAPVTESVHEIPETYTEAKELYKRAHSAFISHNYDEAIEFYEVVDIYIDKDPQKSDFFDHRYRGFSMTELVEQRRTLGEIRPESTFRVSCRLC